MANLFYDTLFARAADGALKRTFYGLGELFRYLKGVEQHLNETRPLLRWDLGGHLVALRTAGNEAPGRGFQRELRGLHDSGAPLRLHCEGRPPLTVLCVYPDEGLLLLAGPLPDRVPPCRLEEHAGRRRLPCRPVAVPRPSLDELLPPARPPLPATATAAERAAEAAAAEAELLRWEENPRLRRFRALRPQWIALCEPKGEGDRTVDAFLDEEVSAVYEAHADAWGRYSDAHELPVRARDPENLLLCVDRLPKTREICVRPNTYVIFRQLEAIRTLQDRPGQPQRPLVDLFQRSEHVTWPSLAQDDAGEPPTIDHWEVLTDVSRPGTEEQRVFVQRALATPDFMLLEGPPGSGKTTAILELVLQLAARGKRALLCASTHVAVDNVIERIKDPRNPRRDSILVVRIGKEDAARSELARGYRLEQMARTESRELLEQLDRLPTRTPAQERLREALQPPKGEGLGGYAA